jgi:hypothetical protein
VDITIDLDDMELGESEFFEEVTGKRLDEMGDGELTTKAIIALVTISQRRTNPDYSLDDARKVKISELRVNPTVAEAEPS